MIDITTVSSKGQIVIPKDVREKAGLYKNDKLLILSEDGKIVLEKISKKDTKEKMLNLLDYFTKEFKKKGISQSDLALEIKATRKQNA